MKKKGIRCNNKVLWLLFPVMISAQIYASEESIETWLLRNQEQQQAILTLSFEADNLCELYKFAADSSYERLPQPLKDKFAKEIVDGDTLASSQLKIKCTAEGLYYSELNEVKIWVINKKEQVYNACFLVNDAYSLFWGEGTSVVTRIDHASLDNLNSEAKLLTSLYGAGYGYLSNYGLPPGLTLLDKYRQRGRDVWSAKMIDDRIAVTVYRDGQLISKRILNPQKNCQVEHYLYYKNGEIYEDSRVVLQKITVSGIDFWLPQEIQTRIYQFTDSGLRWLYKNKTVFLKNIRINSEIPDSVFRLESIAFPAHTRMMVRKAIDGKESAYVFKDGSFVESDGGGEKPSE